MPSPPSPPPPCYFSYACVKLHAEDLKFCCLDASAILNALNYRDEFVTLMRNSNFRCEKFHCKS